MEQQEMQSPVQYAPESLDKQESKSLTTRKKNISSGEDAFINANVFIEELEHDCAV